MLQTAKDIETEDVSNDGICIREYRKDAIPLESVEDTTEWELERALEIWTESNEPIVTRYEFIEKYVFPNESLRTKEWRRVRELLDLSFDALELSWWGYMHYPYELQTRGFGLELRLYQQLMPDPEDGTLYCPNCSGTLDDWTHTHRQKPPIESGLPQSRYVCEDCGYHHNSPWRDIETLVGSD